MQQQGINQWPQDAARLRVLTYHLFSPDFCSFLAERQEFFLCLSLLHAQVLKSLCTFILSPGVYSDAKPTALVEHVWCLSIQKINALVSIFKLTVSSSLRINAIFSFQVFFWRRREFVLSWALNITLFTYAKMYLIHVMHIPLSIFDKTYSLEV